MPQWIPVAIAVLVVCAIIAGIGLAARSRRRRREAFRQAAADLGWTFTESGPPPVPGAPERFRLFDIGRSRRATNSLRGKIEDLDVAVFDYAYTTGSGKSAHRHHQTVAAVGIPAAALPAFDVRPEGFFQRIGTMLGFQDIDIESAPRFSSMFVLRGKDEDAVRALFGESVAGFFEERAGVSAEGSGDRVLLYRADRFVAPDEVLRLTGDAVELATRLTAVRA